jgi:hypothetical protein
MANAVRFPRGLSTFAPRHVLNNFPIATSPSQITLTEDFIPYRGATDYTVTTAVAGTIATFAQLSGAIKLATSASATDTIYAMRLGAAYQFMPLNQLWFNMRVAYPRSVANSNDTNVYLGLFNNAVPTAATDGVYFLKPSGGTAVNFIVKKAGTTTTFQNVADLGIPSGLFGDTNSTNGTLTAVVAGNAFTGISVTTPGAGYQVSPLVLSTTTSGVAGNVPVMVGLGSSATSQTNPQFPIQTTALPYGSLYAPFVTIPGSGYTNSAGSAAYLEVEPFIDLSFYYNGKDTLYVGVNGRAVMSIGPGGVGTAAAGGTINVATATGTPSFFSTAQLTTAVAPVQPIAGSAYNLVPQLPLNIAFGFANTSVNVRNFYVDEYSVAVEMN